ncbi:hypothetical protein BZK31_27955, partial [Pseudomonas floridensis]
MAFRSSYEGWLAGSCGGGVGVAAGVGLSALADAAGLGAAGFFGAGVFSAAGFTGWVFVVRLVFLGGFFCRFS